MPAAPQIYKALNPKTEISSIVETIVDMASIVSWLNRGSNYVGKGKPVLLAVCNYSTIVCELARVELSPLGRGRGGL
jgi:hypothetical protein